MDAAVATRRRRGSAVWPIAVSFPAPVGMSHDNRATLAAWQCNPPITTTRCCVRVLQQPRYRTRGNRTSVGYAVGATALRGEA